MGHSQSQKSLEAPGEGYGQYSLLWHDVARDSFFSYYVDFYAIDSSIHFSLENFVIFWSCWIQRLQNNERLRQRGYKTGYKIPILPSPCIPLLPTGSFSPTPGVPLCSLYAFRLPVLQRQEKPEVRCRVRHPTEHIAVAEWSLITLFPSSSGNQAWDFQFCCSSASWPGGRPDWWLWISINK